MMTIITIPQNCSDISAIAVGTATLDVHPGVTILCARLHHLVIMGMIRW